MILNKFNVLIIIFLLIPIPVGFAVNSCDRFKDYSEKYEGYYKKYENRINEYKEKIKEYNTGTVYDRQCKYYEKKAQSYYLKWRYMDGKYLTEGDPTAKRRAAQYYDYFEYYEEKAKNCYKKRIKKYESYIAKYTKYLDKYYKRYLHYENNYADCIGEQETVKKISFKEENENIFSFNNWQCTKINKNNHCSKLDKYQKMITLNSGKKVVLIASVRYQEWKGDCLPYKCNSRNKVHDWYFSQNAANKCLIAKDLVTKEEYQYCGKQTTLKEILPYFTIAVTGATLATITATIFLTTVKG